MPPEIAIIVLTALVVTGGTVISLTAMFLRHRQRMAGVGGQSGELRQTVQLLTETLERQHERQQGLIRRLDALEAERATPRLSLPDEADAPEAASVRPARVPVR